ncbi:hypothetical protein RHMOL_Rhmol11G0027300 [Rhododendron molle]|uniref:Uncharacterized protein n=1 Tax=Rhododendron molle TaxID=49168 RepID=A0ACC0LP18_RHOML|nr:hypothetical protein RHMOL_Rhmol11G0027300 [Rhododendron molle]
MEYYHLFLAPAAAALPVAPVWPRPPSFVSFHSNDGRKSAWPLLLAQPNFIRCQLGFHRYHPISELVSLFVSSIPTLEMFDLPLQVPAEEVQEWLHAYQSAEVLVRRQRRRILELKAERVPTAGGEGIGASGQFPSLSQRLSQRRRHD